MPTTWHQCFLPVSMPQICLPRTPSWEVRDTDSTSHASTLLTLSTISLQQPSIPTMDNSSLPCHSHHTHHTRDAHATSSTVVDSHAHSQSSGTCCSASQTSSEDLWLNGIDDPGADIERGPPNFERFVLIIDGLQCGCCESGLSRAVSRIPAIRNHQVNVVLARIEFELDTSHLAIAEVIKRLNTKTGYTFSEYVAPTGQVLELLASNAAKLAGAGRPFGVILIEAPEKQSWHRSMLGSGRTSKSLLHRERRHLAALLGCRVKRPCPAEATEIR
jgi:copper chaperone CopZ